MEQYLRCFISEKQDDWIEWLSIIQLTYNIAISESIGMILYFVIYRYEMETSIRKPNYNLAAMMEVVEFRYIYTEIQKELEFVQKRMTSYTNKKRLKGSIFKKGDKVYLS